MMRLATAAAAFCAAPLLSACGPTAEQLQQMPAHFTLPVPGYWDQIATCISDAYGTGLLVPDNRAIPNEKRAEVYLQIRGNLGQRINVALFDIKGDGRNSTVSFHRRSTLINWESTLSEAREKVERCGKTMRQ
jgi:hypothetical protein